MSTHLKGLLLTSTGVLVLTPDSLLIRLIQVDHWTLLFWRGLLMALGLTIVTALLYRGRVLRQLRAVGAIGLLVGASYACSTLFFVTSITHTAVANTLVIVSAAPLFAALFSRIFLHEPIARRTWGAILIGLFAISIIVSQSLRQTALFGDLCALGAAVSLAVNLVALRKARGVNMFPAMAAGGILVALAMSPLAKPLSVDSRDIGLLLLLCLLIVPLAFALISLGPRYLTAPEVSLLMLLETALGPLWVWWIIGETPPWPALIGGSLLILTLVLHSLLALRAGATPQTPLDLH